MLPNLRLIIAAPFASVMVLGCGFGMFAALHVSQEPLHRKPSAPLQLVAIDSAPPVASVIASAPFDNRSRNGQSGGISALAYSTPEPAERPEANVVPEQAESKHTASEPAAVPTPEAAQAATKQPAEVSTVTAPVQPIETAAADTAEAAPLSFIVAALQPPVAEPANATAASAASEQAQPQAPTIGPESSPPAPAKSADKATKETKDREAKKTRVAAGTRRARAARPAGGDAAFELPDFRAPGNWPTETAESAPAKRRHVTAVSNASTTTNAGIGGPFVSAPER